MVSTQRGPVGLAVLLAIGCGGKPTDTGGAVCADVAIRTVDGGADACDLAACEACFDACDEACAIAESYPPQYVCSGVGSWSVYDTCPTWGVPDYTPCDDTTSTVGSADTTPLGFSADDVLATLAGPLLADAEWVAEEGRPNTTVTLTVAANGTPTFHDRERAGTTGPDMQCLDQLEIPITLGFDTGDGAFAEQIPTALWVTDLAAVSAGAALDWQALSGGFAFVTIDPTEWDSVALDLSTTITPVLAGQVQVSTARETGTGMGSGLVGPLLRWPPQ